jgi:hypothetical protein
VTAVVILKFLDFFFKSGDSRDHNRLHFVMTSFDFMLISIILDGIEPWTDVTNVPMINFAEGSTRTTKETISRNITGYFILSPSISPPATFIRTMQNLGVAGIVFGNDLLRELQFEISKYKISSLT